MTRISIRAGALFLALAVLGACQSDGDPASQPSTGESPSPEETVFVPKKAYLKDACELPGEWIKLIHRGWVPGSTRDFDLVIVPDPPNYVGTFLDTSHSGPYEFLQQVPLIFYGPRFIKPLGRTTLGREVTLADVAPTQALLMGFDAWPERVGTPLTEILTDATESPALLVTMVIDGGGWNVLEYWPDAWPNLKDLIERSATIEDAIDGSSPSITPSIHTTLATGTFPRFHGVTGITIRQDDGSITGAFSEEARLTGAEDTVPDVVIKKATIADLWDRANDNEPLMGAIATGNYPLGMLGVGAALRGGDHDILGLTSGSLWATAPDYFSLPDYANTEVEGPENDLAAVDRMDGKADGLWHGHEVKPLDATPALAPWENRTAQAIIEREGFGADELTDMFYINYKSPDYAGHEWNMTAPEQENVISSVDTAIGEMVEWLDTNIGRDRYVLTVTADHGQTPLHEGGWAIKRSEVIADVNRRFDKIDNQQGIIQTTSATSLFLSVDEMQQNKVRPEEVASFLSRYTIGANIPQGEEIPAEFADRTEDRIFSAVFPGRRLPDIATCTGALEL